MSNGKKLHNHKHQQVIQCPSQNRATHARYADVHMYATLSLASRKPLFSHDQDETQHEVLASSSNEKKQPKAKFCINDHRDILVEILKRLDGRSVGVAACVCRLWCKLATSDDSIWEHICFRHVSPPGVRPLVLALGGYKKLYMVCVRPVLGRLDRKNKGGRAGRWVVQGESELSRRVWTRQGAQLLLSLFCVDYYEKLGGNGGGNIGSDASPPPSSLMLLCKPVNV